VAALLVVTLAGLTGLALRAPVVYANPDQLYLRNNVSTANATDQTLDAEGTLLATMLFSNGTTFSWLSSTSYSGGTVAGGTYTFKLDWSTNTCGALGGSACTVTVNWGYCNSGCTTLQSAAATFSFTLNSSSGSPGTATASTPGAAITLSGCPCNFYVHISSISSASANWTLAYDGNAAACTTQCDDTNIQTPSLPVSEHVIGVPALILLAPIVGLFVAGRQRLARRRAAKA
jgi:hypothetical protein